MPERTEDEIRSILATKGICPGASVSWDTNIAGISRRYGCVLSYASKGNVTVQCSNGKHEVAGVVLRVEPDVSDPISEDLVGIYGRQ